MCCLKSICHSLRKQLMVKCWVRTFLTLPIFFSPQVAFRMLCGICLMLWWLRQLSTDIQHFISTCSASLALPFKEWKKIQTTWYLPESKVQRYFHDYRPCRQLPLWSYTQALCTCELDELLMPILRAFFTVLHAATNSQAAKLSVRIHQCSDQSHR